MDNDMEDKTNNLDRISVVGRAVERIKKSVFFLEKYVWIAMAIDGVLVFIVILIRVINLIELTLTRPVLIQTSLFFTYAALVGFLVSVFKIHRKSYGPKLIRVMVYLGMDWLGINLLLMMCPSLINALSQ